MVKYKCLSCNKEYSKRLNVELKNKLKNIFKFSNNDIYKLILMLWKGVYPYEYMYHYATFNGTTLPEKMFFSNLTMESITEVN